MIFGWGKKKRETKARAKKLYASAVEQARLAVFYEQYGVPDSFDGRFEMLCLHMFVILREIKEDKGLAQALFDEMFVNMDQTIREIGVGDVGVPKHMQRMMKGFNGRMLAYEAGLSEGSLEEALERNIYGTVEKADPDHVSALAQYVRAASEEDRECKPQAISRS